jgi:hypothetical protein
LIARTIANSQKSMIYLPTLPIPHYHQSVLESKKDNASWERVHFCYHLHAYPLHLHPFYLLPNICSIVTPVHKVVPCGTQRCPKGKGHSTYFPRKKTPSLPPKKDKINIEGMVDMLGTHLQKIAQLSTVWQELYSHNTPDNWQ